MKFYATSHPSVGEVTMCTVTEYNEGAGFNVHLDEYDLDGFIMLIELHNKKIRGPISGFLKIGTQLPLSVLDSDSDQVYLSKKDVKEDQVKQCKERYALNNRLFNLIKRLPQPAGDSHSWEEIFQELNLSMKDADEEHPWTLIQDREWDDLDLNAQQVSILAENHAKLFGIKPQTVHVEFSVYSFAVNGNQVVQDILIKVRNLWNRVNDGNVDSWSHEDLYEEGSRCNLTILPVAVPKFQLKVTAYNRDRCYDVINQVKSELEQAKLDHVQFQTPETVRART